MYRVGVALVIVAALVAGSLLFFQPEEQATSEGPKYSDLLPYIWKNKGKVPKLKQRPNDWYVAQRAYPYQTIPPQKQVAGMTAARQAKAAKSPAWSKSITWTEGGPTNVPGRITDLAIHPSDINTVYAGAAAGGVFKSTNGGGTWAPIFDSVGTFSIGALAIDPTDEDIVYVGTGEANASADSYEGTGVYKSIDAGNTWTHLGLDSSYHIGRIVVDPLRPDTLFVAVGGKHFGAKNPDRGLYRSQDGGSTWEQILYISDSTSCIDVAYDPVSGTVLAAMWEKVRYVDIYKVYGGITSGIYRSTDHGDSFTLLGAPQGLPAPSTNTGRIGVTMDVATGICYALYIALDTYEYMGMYKSFDYGATWSLLPGASALDGSFGGFGWYFGNVRVAPNDPSVVFSLGVRLFRSQDGGNSWSNVTGNAHVDFHAMWIDPSNSSRIYSGCDGGVNYTTNQANDWTVMANMPNTQFYAITVDPSNPERIYGGTQDNGTNGTKTGNVDDYLHIFGGDGFYTLVDPRDPDVIYCEYQWGNMYKSTDGGNSWSWAMNGIDYAGDRHNWNTPIAMDPTNPDALYYGSNRLWKTTNAANDWDVVSPDLSGGPYPDKPSYGTITTIGVSRLNSQVIYVGTDDGRVQVTTNGGTTWTRVDAGLPDRWVTRVVPDQYDVNTAYVTISGYQWSEPMAHIYKTTNNGSTWVPVSGDLPDVPVMDLIVDPHIPDRLYAGTDVGVWATDNGGTNWYLLSDGAPIATVHDMEFHFGTRKLVIGTHGRSTFYTFLDCTGSTDADSDGILDDCDNCPNIANVDQTDSDADLIGDDCDDCTDHDGDGFGTPGFPNNTCPDDNCPFVYNPGQEDEDNDGIGDVCDTRYGVWDTVQTDCMALTVGTNGNFGNQGIGGANMDFASSGDCNPGNSVYLYDGSPVILWEDGGQYFGYWSIFGQENFDLADDMKLPVPTIETSEYHVFESGTFITEDSSIALENTWWSPQDLDSCNFIIRRTNYFSYDGSAHTGLTIGEAVDWDVPSASGSDNTGGFTSSGIVYLRGTGSGCQDNTTRFGAQAMLGFFVNDSCGLVLNGSPYGAYTADNPTYVYPNGGFVASELYTNMQSPGYSADVNQVDQHAVVTYLNNFDLGSSDTLVVFSVLISLQSGTTGDLDAELAKAKIWLQNHLFDVCSNCCEYSGDINHDGSPVPDIADLVYLVDFMFGGGPNPPCEDPTGFYPETNVNGDANAPDIADVVYLVSYMFQGGPPPVPCQ